MTLNRLGPKSGSETVLLPILLVIHVGFHFPNGL